MQELILSGEELYQVVTSILQDPNADTIRIRCEGTSMHPSIRTGSVVAFNRIATGKEIRVGTIVVAILDGVERVVVHRVIKTAASNNQFLLKGDNVPTADGWIDASRIVGTVWLIESPTGRVSKPLASWNWIMALFSKWKVLFPFLRMLRWAKCSFFPKNR